MRAQISEAQDLAPGESMATDRAGFRLHRARRIGLTAARGYREDAWKMVIWRFSYFTSDSGAVDGARATEFLRERRRQTAFGAKIGPANGLGWTPGVADPGLYDRYRIRLLLACGQYVIVLLHGAGE